mmetsp:Transcript_41830/g.104919  ORF Transcript_41830/g.104919 Transcript_41830/m.104919 type:complete len:232 (-) Transcript_41830:319-1014(-)
MCAHDSCEGNVMGVGIPITADLSTADFGLVILPRAGAAYYLKIFVVRLLAVDPHCCLFLPAFCRLRCPPTPSLLSASDTHTVCLPFAAGVREEDPGARLRYIVLLHDAQGQPGPGPPQLQPQAAPDHLPGRPRHSLHTRLPHLLALLPVLCRPHRAHSSCQLCSHLERSLLLLRLLCLPLRAFSGPGAQASEEKGVRHSVSGPMPQQYTCWGNVIPQVPIPNSHSQRSAAW